MSDLPDIQEDTKPEIKTFIKHVGIDNVKVPVHFIENHINYQTVASVSMSTFLNINDRALSLSEFLRYYKEYEDKPIVIPDDIIKLLNNFQKISRTDHEMAGALASIKFKFEYKKNIPSPVSNNSFPQFYPCFLGFNLYGDRLIIYRGITVQYSSYCPCSQALCDHAGQGIPHAQRSYCDLIIETRDSTITFDRLISLIEDCVVNKIYPIVRRVDEQDIAIKASNNTFFIEDIIRKIKSKIIKVEGIDDWFLQLRHKDSIHSHDVIAKTWSSYNISEILLIKE